MKKKDRKVKSSLIVECFNNSRDATTTVLTILTLLISTSCFVPLVFLVDRITLSQAKSEPLDLLFIYLLVVAVFYHLIRLFTPIFKNVLEGNLLYSRVKSMLPEISPRLFLEKNFSFANIYSELKRKTLESSGNLFRLIGSFFGALFLAVSISYFAPWAVLIYTLGSILTFWYVKTLETPLLKSNTAKEFLTSPKLMFEAEYYNATEFFFSEVMSLLKDEDKRLVKNLKIENLIVTSGKVTRTFAHLLSIAVSGYYFLENNATLGSVVIVLVFGGIYQKEFLNVLLSIKGLFKRDDFVEETKRLISDFKDEEDLDSYLESQIRDKFELEENLNLCVELKNVSYPLPSGLKVNDLALSIFTGDRIQILCTRKEQKAFLEILLGIKKPDSGEVAYIDVDDGTISRLRALRQIALMSLPDMQEEIQGLTLRELVGFGDIAKINDDEGILEALTKTGVLQDKERSNIIDYALSPSTSDEKKLLYARALFGERRFFLIDGSSLDFITDASLIEEILSDTRNTVLFFVRERIFSESVGKTICLSDYTA